MSDTAHTPLPWHASRKHNFINSAGNVNIATMNEGPRKEADAAFIDLAVNTHDMLVAALIEARAELVDEWSLWLTHPSIVKIDAALARAKARVPDAVT